MEEVAALVLTAAGSHHWLINHWLIKRPSLAVGQEGWGGEGGRYPGVWPGQLLNTNQPPDKQEPHSLCPSFTPPLSPRPFTPPQDFGRRLDVWWPAERRYFRGTITAYSSSQQRHTVRYDDGDQGRVFLPAEKYRWVGGRAAVKACACHVVSCSCLTYLSWCWEGRRFHKLIAPLGQLAGSSPASAAARTSAGVQP